MAGRRGAPFDSGDLRERNPSEAVVNGGAGPPTPPPLIAAHPTVGASFGFGLAFPASGNFLDVGEAGFRARPFARKRWIVAPRTRIDRVDPDLKRKRDAIPQHNGLLLSERGQLVQQFAVDSADDAFEVFLIVRVLNAMNDEAVALSKNRSRQL